MRKFYLHIFSLILFVFLTNKFISQNGIISVNTSTTEIKTNPSGSWNGTRTAGAFWGNQCSNPFDSYNCGGYEGTSGKNVVTPEALSLTLTSTIRNQLNVGGSYTEFADDLNSVSAVNVYMVYLNSNDNWRSNPGEVVFEGEILGVYTKYDQTLYFASSSFSSSEYPVYANSNAQGKFEDRRFEPDSWNSGTWHNSWDDQNNSDKDWFHVRTANGNSKINPNGTSGSNGSGGYMFRIGCKNGQKGDFFRVITRVSCSEPTGAGSIGNPQSGCGSFNPSTITNSSSGSGGSGGTATYFWQKSTTSSSSGFSTISGATSSTYNPSTIYQTTWYRRGY